MGYNREDYENRDPKQYRIELYVQSDCPLTKEEARDYIKRIKSCFKDDSLECILSCCVQENKTRGKTRINNIEFKNIYIKEQ